MSTLLVTGGSGLLGRHLHALAPSGTLFPDHAEFELRDPALMGRYLDAHPGTATILHAAAFTSPPAVDRDPARALAVNIGGTASLAVLCIERRIRLVYVSTDYVFRGDRGGYAEDDALHPVNAYAWSKLGGECAVRLVPVSLIIRTSFGPVPFPYPKAISDQFTSRLPADQAAKRILRATLSSCTGVLHIGGPRRSVLEYARVVSPDAGTAEIRRADLPFSAPADTSLDTALWTRTFPTEP